MTGVLNVDWAAYERSVEAAVRRAVDSYARVRSPEFVFQISIWTDPQARVTAVGFETREHAGLLIEQAAQRFRARGRSDIADKIWRLGYASNPADFKYREYLTINHPELEALAEVDFADHAQEQAVLSRISESLIAAVERLERDGAFRDLPREQVVWIGVNSPKDWYDHVRPLAS
jgi:hypothetical protein